MTLPKKWRCRITDQNIEELLAWRDSQPDFISTVHAFKGWLLCDKHDGSYVHYRTGVPEGYTEITFEQLMGKQDMRTIEWSQGQEIIDAACKTWKDTLFTKWGKQIVLRQDITIEEAFYQDMREACTEPQYELFDKIFGKDEYIPEGTPCLVRDCDGAPWKFGYSNGDGTFQMSETRCFKWDQVQVLDMNNLPKI